MIVWLNGPFGVGKTTVGALVVERQDNLRLFHPEEVGRVLANNLRDHAAADFQDWPAWRRLVPAVAAEIADMTRQSLLAVQSVLIEQYWNELQASLHAHDLVPIFHVLLTAHEQELRARIEADDSLSPGARDFRLRRTADIRAAHHWLAGKADAVIDTTDIDPVTVADAVLTHLAPRL